MVSPFAPHLGEECWDLLGNNKGDGVAFAPWIQWKEELCVSNTVTLGVQVICLFAGRALVVGGPSVVLVEGAGPVPVFLCSMVWLLSMAWVNQSIPAAGSPNRTERAPVCVRDLVFMLHYFLPFPSTIRLPPPAPGCRPSSLPTVSAVVQNGCVTSLTSVDGCSRHECCLCYAVGQCCRRWTGKREGTRGAGAEQDGHERRRSCPRRGPPASKRINCCCCGVVFFQAYLDCCVNARAGVRVRVRGWPGAVSVRS